MDKHIGALHGNGRHHGDHRVEDRADVGQPSAALERAEPLGRVRPGRVDACDRVWDASMRWEMVTRLPDPIPSVAARQVKNGLRRT
jgi:hypothetical protein